MPRKHPPRKLHKLSFSDFGNMEVVSITDYERAQDSQQDMILHSAVDQLEALARPGDSTPDMAAVLVRFGELNLDDGMPSFRFDFAPPIACKSWPGPRYEAYCLHKEIAKPISNQAVRKHRQADDLKQTAQPRKAAKPKKSKKAVEAPKISPPAVSRDPPLHLLGLPAEIRNAIWTLLAVRREIVEAQLRRIRPCKKLSKIRDTVIRRFPREPVVAAVSHQLRKEVLSIFYGCNHFVFEKNACGMFREYSMLNSATMQKWKPRSDIATFLAHVDVRFNALPRLGSMLSVVYTLRRLRNGKSSVDVKAEKSVSKKVVQISEHCLCTEMEVAAQVKDIDCGQDLVEMATALISQRTAFMFGKGDSLKYPSEATCSKCDKMTFEIVYSGV